MQRKPSFSTHFFVYRTLDGEALDLIAGAGFGEIELWGMLPHFPYRDERWIGWLGDALAARSLRPATAHLPIYRHRDDAVRRGEFIGFGHPDPEVRRAAGVEIEACAKALSALGVAQVVLHADVHPGPEAGASEGHLLEGLARLLELFPGRIALENILWETAHPLPLGHLVARLRARVGGEGARLGACIDLGHAAATGTLTPALGTLAGSVYQLHLSDTHPPKDEHLPPGEGTIDWDATGGIVQAMRVEGPLVMEIRAREPLRETVQAIGRAATDLARRWST